MQGNEGEKPSSTSTTKFDKKKGKHTQFVVCEGAALKHKIRTQNKPELAAQGKGVKISILSGKRRPNTGQGPKTTEEKGKKSHTRSPIWNNQACLSRARKTKEIAQYSISVFRPISHPRLGKMTPEMALIMQLARSNED